MYDQLTSAPSLAPHTADVAELLAADRLDLAAAAHDRGADRATGTDAWMAGVLLEAPCLAQHTADVAEMIAAGHANSARAMHLAYINAEFEREDLGAGAPNMRDIWMAGVLLEATWEQARSVGAMSDS